MDPGQIKALIKLIIDGPKAVDNIQKGLKDQAEKEGSSPLKTLIKGILVAIATYIALFIGLILLIVLIASKV